MVAKCEWVSVGVLSLVVWPSSFRMVSSQSATLMGSGCASSYFSLLISLMTRSVIMSEPSCFPAFIRLWKAASLPVSCELFVWEHLVNAICHRCVRVVLP